MLSLRNLPESPQANRRGPSSTVQTSNGAMASLPVRCVAHMGRRRHRNTFQWRVRWFDDQRDGTNTGGANSRLGGMTTWGLSRRAKARWRRGGDTEWRRHEFGDRSRRRWKTYTTRMENERESKGINEGTTKWGEL